MTDIDLDFLNQVSSRSLTWPKRPAWACFPRACLTRGENAHTNARDRGTESRWSNYRGDLGGMLTGVMGLGKKIMNSSSGAREKSRA